MSPFPFPSDGFSAAADFARRFEELRRSGEARTTAALLALVDVADAVGRLADDPSLADLPANWRDGLAALHGKIHSSLASQSVTPIPTDTLDLRLHHIAETIDGPGEPDRIARVVRPGYLWNERVLRPAEVVTVKPHPDRGTSP